jgi:hypothetical protein
MSPPDSFNAGPGASPPGPDPFQPLWERGISPEVAEARGYMPYYGRHHPLYDPDALRAALERYPMSNGQRNTLMQFARNARDAPPGTDTFLRFAGEDAVTRGVDEHDGRGMGLLMPKYEFPFPDVLEVLPQLRPEYPVRTGGTTWHRHDKAFFDDAEGLARHIADEHGGDESFPDEKFHQHEDFAKYLLAPLEKEDVWHDHEEDPRFRGPKGQVKLSAHLRRSKHTTGERLHKHRRDKRGQHVADRLDVHPWALDRLIAAERIYFGLEGTPKADAILSRIIAAGAPASVFNCPSVTLWKAPELPEVVDLLVASAYFVRAARSMEKLAVIVCDADWHENPAVVRQALLCREYLRARNLSACVAAPPMDRNAKGKLLYKGVDDFLAAGGELDELRVIDYEARFSLALYADKEHKIRGSLWSLAELLGCGRDADSILGTLHRHIDAGAIISDRPLNLGVDEWSSEKEWTGKPKAWPTFTIREDLRRTEQFVRLGDYRPRPQITRDDAVTAALLVHPKPPDAVRLAANWLGITERALRETPSVRATLKGVDEMRRQMINVRVTTEMNIPTAELASEFGVSPRTIGRYAKGPDGEVSDLGQLPPWLGSGLAQLLREITTKYGRPDVLMDKKTVGDG